MANTEEKSKSIYDLKLHEHTFVGNNWTSIIRVPGIRVPGGWIYIVLTIRLRKAQTLVCLFRLTMSLRKNEPVFEKGDKIEYSNIA